jgi:hypothetical protein
MESRKASLIQQIEAAFAATPRPSDREISAPTCDDEGTAAYFRGKSWRTGHTVKDLRLHDSSLSFFTPQAFRYFLPAYMLATIEDPDTADVIPGGIEYHLAEGDGAQALRPLLTNAEREAVGAFFRYLSDLWTDGWGPPLSRSHNPWVVIGHMTSEEQRVARLMEKLEVSFVRDELRCVQVAEAWRALTK